MVETAQPGDSADFRVGVPEMDVEHALQFELLRAFGDALSRADRETAVTVITRLDDVTNAHFLAEQLLMLLHAYPGFQQHQREHDQLIEELRSIRAELTTPGGLPTDITAESIERWLLHHIQTSDRAFAAFLEVRRREEEPGPEAARQ